jgi:hypothetical protein
MWPVIEAYRARWDLPHLPGNDRAAEARILAAAVARGRPVPGWLISRVTGSWRRDPGEDVCL